MRCYRYCVYCGATTSKTQYCTVHTGKWFRLRKCDWSLTRCRCSVVGCTVLIGPIRPGILVHYYCARVYGGVLYCSIDRFYTCIFDASRSKAFAPSLTGWQLYVFSLGLLYWGSRGALANLIHNPFLANSGCQVEMMFKYLYIGYAVIGYYVFTTTKIPAAIWASGIFTYAIISLLYAMIL